MQNELAFLPSWPRSLENARLQTEAERQADQISALFETARDLSVQHDLPALLETIVDRAVALLGARASIVYLYDASRGELQVKLKKNVDIPTDRRVQLGEGMAGRVAQTRQPLIADDAATFGPPAQLDLAIKTHSTRLVRSV